MKPPKKIQDTQQAKQILHNLYYNNTEIFASVNGEHLTIQIPMFQATANLLYNKLTQKEEKQ